MRKKGEIGTVTNATEDADIKAPKLLEFIEATDPKVAKTGERIQFMHDASEEDEGLFYWLEGRVQQGVTKTSRAKNIGELKVISMWGKQTKPLPSSVCTNLAPNLGWTILTETDSVNRPVGEETTIELDLATVPTSKRPEEVNQEEAVETSDNQLGNRETCQNTG